HLGERDLSLVADLSLQFGADVEGALVAVSRFRVLLLVVIKTPQLIECSSHFVTGRAVVALANGKRAAESRLRVSLTLQLRSARRRAVQSGKHQWAGRAFGLFHDLDGALKFGIGRSELLLADQQVADSDQVRNQLGGIGTF